MSIFDNFLKKKKYVCWLAIEDKNNGLDFTSKERTIEHFVKFTVSPFKIDLRLI